MSAIICQSDLRKGVCAGSSSDVFGSAPYGNFKPATVKIGNVL
jgi:hypothetical protein